MIGHPFVVLDDVAKRWNGQLGIENISLEIEEGSFVAFHHPPFVSEVEFMDAVGRSNPNDLAEILRHAGRDMRLVCGHIHSVQFAMIGGYPVLSTPATCSTFDVDFRPDAPVGFFDDPGGFLLHDWSAGFRTHTVPSILGPGPYPFKPIVNRQD